MTRLLLTTLGANRRGPLGTIEQRDLIEEGHLAHVLDLYLRFLLHVYLNLNRFTVGAPSLLVLPIPTKGALPQLLGLTVLRLMSPLSTAETFDLVRVTIHEDWHFCRSLHSWDEGCGLGRGSCRGRERPLQLILDQAVEVGVLDMVFCCDQVLLDDDIPLGDFIEMVLRVPA